MADDDLGWLDQEREGANSGINPMFGEWKQSFDFSPVPYGDGGAKREAFRSAVQSRISSKFFFSHDVQVDITLLMDVQSVRETSDTADVDNYAKCILDALKGPNGIILDDSQVQALSIHWLSKRNNKDPSFDVQIRSSADAFRLKPLSFYEMPSGLWYPFSKFLWTDGKAELCSDLNLYAGLRIEASMTDALRKARHIARQLNSSRAEAYWRSMPLASGDVRGFHKSRIDSDFAMINIKTWRQSIATWASESVEGAKLFQILNGMEENHLVMAKLLGGWVPSEGSLV